MEYGRHPLIILRRLLLIIYVHKELADRPDMACARQMSVSIIEEVSRLLARLITNPNFCPRLGFACQPPAGNT